MVTSLTPCSSQDGIPSQQDKHLKEWQPYHGAQRPCSLHSLFYAFTMLTMRKQKAQIILL